MILKDREIKDIISHNNLTEKDNLLFFLKNNPNNLNLLELSRIAELSNSSRIDTAAYYTNQEVLKVIYGNLPKIEKSTIRVLEPSAGIGNFLEIIIAKYAYAEQLIIDVNDIDKKSLEILDALNKYRNIPKNVTINYINDDFLSDLPFERYDLVIGNPPFLKKNLQNGLKELSKLFDDLITKNTSGFFLQKALEVGTYVVMIMPKYFLNNPDFQVTRERIKQYSIDKIIDFGEKGFKGVLIETIAVFINKNKRPNLTLCESIPLNFINEISQEKMTSEEYPYWLIYRNEFFDEISSKMKFGVFKVFRDRQITNSLLNAHSGVRVLKSRNIKRDGSGIINLVGYDAYIDIMKLKDKAIYKYYERDDVYLSPNMTYYPRVIRKPKNVVTNGSVAILENITEYKITDRHLKFFNSKVFEEYYRIARNYSTRSLNIDANSVYFFGLYQ